MNIHDVTDPPVPIPTLDEDIFHESIGQDNYAILDHMTPHKPLPPEHLH